MMTPTYLKLCKTKAFLCLNSFQAEFAEFITEDHAFPSILAKKHGPGFPQMEGSSSLCGHPRVYNSPGGFRDRGMCLPDISPLPVACNTAVGVALVGAAKEEQGPHRAESVGVVAVVGWKTEKRHVLAEKLRWFVHEGLCGKIRPDA